MAKADAAKTRANAFLFRDQLADLRSRTEAYLEAGGPLVDARKKGVGFNKYKSKTVNSKETVEGRAILSDVLDFRKKTTKSFKGDRNASGFALYERFNNESFDLVSALSPRMASQTGRGVLPNKVKKTRDSLEKKQLSRDARVATTIAAQRDSVTRRRNRSLIPGSSSDLRKRTNTLFSTDRKGTLV